MQNIDLIIPLLSFQNLFILFGVSILIVCKFSNKKRVKIINFV